MKRVRTRPADIDDDADSVARSELSELTLSDESSIIMSPPSQRTTVTTAASPSARGVASPAVADTQVAWQVPFDTEAKQTYHAALPIFRRSDVKQYGPVDECRDDELQAMTFDEGLGYFLRLPAYATKRKASNAMQYKVRWSYPPLTDTWVSRAAFERLEENRAVVEAYRKRTADSTVVSE